MKVHKQSLLETEKNTQWWCSIQLGFFAFIGSFTSISISLIPPKKTTYVAVTHAGSHSRQSLTDHVTLLYWVAVRMRWLTSNMFGAQASSAPVYDWKLISSSTFEKLGNFLVEIPTRLSRVIRDVFKTEKKPKRVLSFPGQDKRGGRGVPF